nr:MAG TPA: hypothetical protein [Caudoviricetes sp.]
MVRLELTQSHRLTFCCGSNLFLSYTENSTILVLVQELHEKKTKN